MIFLDCTLRDGGYYNGWDFSTALVDQYLEAMAASGVDAVELGFRSLKTAGFMGPWAYTTDNSLKSLALPESLAVAVMINASEVVQDQSLETLLQRLFPASANESPVDIVRIACHVHEFQSALPAASWLKERGYKVGFNLMQAGDRTQGEIEELAALAQKEPVDVFYFADSMGSLTPESTSRIIHWIQRHFSGAIGVHTHDNLGLAMSNTLRAAREGATWLDATVTGMGRGPGNARTEELATELAEQRNQDLSLVPLMKLIREQFQPLKEEYGWGTNIYYYIAGKYGIHPTYIQEMLNDPRYKEEDIISVINHLKHNSGKRFSPTALTDARKFFSKAPEGTWDPRNIIDNQDVLILGTGPSVKKYKNAIETFIVQQSPIVLALNAKQSIDEELIDYRVACHPIRLLTDTEKLLACSSQLILPFSMLPQNIQDSYSQAAYCDFGISFHEEPEPNQNFCTVPAPLVFAYAAGVAIKGSARNIYLAGFDGYIGDDRRMNETKAVIEDIRQKGYNDSLISITPTRHKINTASVYGLIH